MLKCGWKLDALITLTQEDEMRGVNKVILVGTVGRDPEVKELNTGRLTNMSLATSDQWRDKESGERKERTEWHKLVCFGRLADIAEQYVVKGTRLYIEGSLSTKEWQDKAGVRHFTTQVIVSDLQMLSEAKTRVKSPQIEDKEGEEWDDAQIPF